MKAPRVLQYSWEDLTSTEEIDHYFVDKIRQCLLTIKANSATPGYVFLRRLFDEIGEYVLKNPKSDAAIILARLIEGLDKETLKTTTAFDLKDFIYVQDLSVDSGVSMEQFLIMTVVVFDKSPMPVVLGERPRIQL